MAKPFHKPEKGTPATQSRCYTLGYIRDHIKHQPSPSITLRGHWMETLGFETGKKVEVISGRGELIILLIGE